MAQRFFSLTWTLLWFVAQAASHPHFDAVAESWEDGPYMFILYIQEVNKNRAPDPAAATPWSLQRPFIHTKPHPHTFDPGRVIHPLIIKHDSVQI